VRIGVDAQRRAEVCVENAGPDIDPQHIPRLFDRFFRADESRTDGHLHHGLGLAIVAAIARMHSGDTTRFRAAHAHGSDLPSPLPPATENGAQRTGLQVPGAPFEPRRAQ
jgi:signal transduction histidine kinase